MAWLEEAHKQNHTKEGARGGVTKEAFYFHIVTQFEEFYCRQEFASLNRPWSPLLRRRLHIHTAGAIADAFDPDTTRAVVCRLSSQRLSCTPAPEPRCFSSVSAHVRSLSRQAVSIEWALPTSTMR